MLRTLRNRTSSTQIILTESNRSCVCSKKASITVHYDARDVMREQIPKIMEGVGRDMWNPATYEHSALHVHVVNLIECMVYRRTRMQKDLDRIWVPWHGERTKSEGWVVV